jgi:UDP-glucuronate decarboxylase
VFGDGRQTRSFCYVDDLVRGMMQFMDSAAGITGPINFGNPNEFTMLELAETVIRKVGGRSKISFRPLPGDDPKQRQPDITKARAKLGWEPKVPVREGLASTVAYFRELLADEIGSAREKLVV